MCLYCGKYFTNQRQNDEHVKIVHEGIKPHKCEFCNECFSYRKYLKIHIKKNHQDPLL